MIRPSALDQERLAGVDPLDRQRTDLAAERRAPRPLAWSRTSIPVAVLLLVGVALGPIGIGFLSAGALGFLDPVIPVALAVLGVLVGLGDGTAPPDRREATAAGVGAALAFGAMVLLALGLARMWPGVATTPLLLGLVAGTCAVTSSGASRRGGAQIIIAIAAGGLVLAALRASSPLAPVFLTVQAALAALVLAAAGWLLLSGPGSDTEQRIFALAALLLVGGAADYLSWSALLAGLIAGTFWRRVDGPARDSIERDAQRVQRPLAVLVLVMAGARAEPSVTAFGLAAAYLAVGLAAAAIGHLVTPAPSTGRLRLQPASTLPPTVFSVAFALNALRAAGPDLTMVLTVVVLGTIGAEVLMGVFRPRQVDA